MKIDAKIIFTCVVFQLPRYVEVTVVMGEGHVVHVQGLVGHGQVPVGGRLTGPVVHLLGDGQLLFVVLDGLRTHKSRDLNYIFVGLGYRFRVPSDIM